MPKQLGHTLKNYKIAPFPKHFSYLSNATSAKATLTVSKYAAMETDWKVDCSDDESYGLTYSELCQQWMPDPETLVQLIESFNGEKTCTLLKLEWTCPGRKDPNAKEDDGDIENEEQKTEEKSDFDFWDEPNSSSKPGPRRAGPGLNSNKQPRGSAKKKTTSLDGILSSMRRHRKLDQMEKTPTTAPNPSPKTS